MSSARRLSNQVVVCLLIIFLSCPARPKPIVLTVDEPRWISPCSGRHVVRHSHRQVAEDDVIRRPEAEAEAAESNNRFDTAELALFLRSLAVRAKRLEHRVTQLKTLYVRHRFRDEEAASELDRIGLTLAGLPEIDQPTHAVLSEDDLPNVVHRAYEDLARVAVFIDQARIDEVLAIREWISFERNFSRLEDHHEYGLYWLLCALQAVIGRTQIPAIAPEVLDAIRSMRVVAVDRNSVRHTRDYVVLRHFERLLDRISVEFTALGVLNRPNNGDSLPSVTHRLTSTPSSTESTTQPRSTLDDDADEEDVD